MNGFLHDSQRKHAVADRIRCLSSAEIATRIKIVADEAKEYIAYSIPGDNYDKLDSLYLRKRLEDIEAMLGVIIDRAEP